MKRILILIACLLFSFINNLIADNIPITGPWEEGGPKRSITPTAPIASINENVVSVCSPDALVDLHILITYNQGSIIFQQFYSFKAGETVDLPVSLEEGEYIIVLSHGWRYLMGEFEVTIY